MSQMTMNCLKEMLIMPAFVSAAQRSELGRHFSAEKEILKFIFAFDNMNYARDNA